MLSVIRKEWRSYFATPIGYVFIAIFWLLGAAFFFLYNILAATANLSSLFGNLSYLFMLIVPLLTMRLFSEERKQKTDQLFYCAPVTLWSVVLGKFLAAVGVLGVSLAGTGLYLVILSRYTTLAVGSLVAHYLAFALLGACYIAVGMFMSTLTDSQITAAVLALAANMLLQLGEMSSANTVSPYLPFLPALMKCIALNQHYAQIASGVFYPTDVGYFIAFAAVFLCASVGVLAGRKRR